MASQSSAVLDLNDADVTDDTDAPSVSEDVEDVPLIMEHEADIAVKVDCPMKQLSTLETFVTYRVRCVCARWQAPPCVRRRYNHFKELHRRLTARSPWLCAPALPALHSPAQQLDRYSPKFVLGRARALNVFLEQIAQHPILTHNEDFRVFLTTPDDEFDKIFKNENNALNLWGLGTALYGGSNEPKPVNGARVKDPEFTAASDYLTSLQGKLTTLYALTVKLYKGTNALGADYMNMKRSCDAWAVSAPRLGRGAAGVARAGAALADAAAGARPPGAALALPAHAGTAAALNKLLQRRALLHAEHVAGNAASDDLHNRLEQATEAIRAELGYWVPKTRADVRRALLQLAERQCAYHAHSLREWERAIRPDSLNDTSDLFKTVSRNAVLNLSPSKCKQNLTENTDSDHEVENPVKMSSDSSDSIKDLTADVQENIDSNDASKVSDPLRSFSEVDLS